ncbi:MAG: translation initiation factor IF-2 [Thermoplasmata archaeon]
MYVRQPIVSVLGHVDHGKTTFLDRVRGTTVADREAGKITQHIGATEVPVEVLEEACSDLGCNVTFSLPGLLFIDTPGHHSFVTLRSRGGALADLAVLIVDLKEGFKPQSLESLDILRREKTPFVVAANKLDRIAGWDSQNKPFIRSFPEQSKGAQDRMTEALYQLIGDLYDKGFSSDRYDNVQDFSKNIGIVPMSAKTGEGIEDMLMTLIGLAQTFLKGELMVDEGPAFGTILEVKEVVGLGTTFDTIIYEGILKKGDEVVIGTQGEPLKTHIKSLLKPKPLDEIRDPRERFDEVEEVSAAAGIKLVTQETEGVLSGIPLRVVGDRSLENVFEEVKEESEPSIELSDEGIIIQADAIGSLEGLASELEDKDIPISKANIGDVSHKDIVEAATLPDPLHRVILAFNVDILPDAKETLRDMNAEVFTAKVVYQLVDDFEEWMQQKKKELEEERRDTIVHPGKFRILDDKIFRLSKPAVVGVRVLAGSIEPERKILRADGRVVGNIKSIRDGDQTLDRAEQGEEVAIAISGVTIGRQLKARENLYIEIPEGDARKLRDIQLTFDENRILDEVREIKKKEQPFWGM